jgi:electron transport protein HydN
MACPFGAVELVATGEIMADGSPKRVAHKCDLCARVADSPCCVKVCLTDALELVTEDDLRDNILEKRRSAVASTMI